MTQAFNLSQLANKVNTSGQLDASTGLYNQTPVANGGTGLSSVTSGAVLLGAGTSAMTVLAGTTPGTVIGSSPTGWSAVPNTSVGGGDYIMRTYTSPSPWAAPAALKAVKVTVIGGGGNGGSATTQTPSAASIGGGGGSGAFAQTYYDAPALSPLTITAGAGTNSFGALISCTAGSNGSSVTNSVSSTGGAGGAVTPSPTIQIAINGFSGAGGNTPGGGLTGNTNTEQGGGANTFMGYGFGGNANGPGTLNGQNGFGFGSGGAGGRRMPTAGNGTNPGGTGAPGVVIVEEFY